MSVLFITIGFSFLIALVFLGGFLWSIKSGQFEDPEGPAVRMLCEDKTIIKDSKTNNKS